MITHSAHLARILEGIDVMPSFSADLRVGAEAYLGRVLADDVCAHVPLPVFTNSAMDGYAVRADDVSAGGFLPVLGDIPAGDTRELTLAPGAAYRIMTGAPVPVGADTIVPVEQSDGGSARVTFTGAVERGRHIRHCGEDVVTGDVLLSKGTKLTPAHIAVLVSSGASRVELVELPKVAIISTGDELRDPGSMLAHGQIHDSNGPMLAACVQAVGARVHSVHRIRDTEADVERVLADVTGENPADVVITTGGVSAGAYDVVKGALLAHGDVKFDRVAMQPGKPQGYGKIRGIPTFTLPGNPMSGLVSFCVFVAPTLAAMMGASASVWFSARAQAGWRTPPERAQFARVNVAISQGECVITPNTRQGSHHLGELGMANALAYVPADVEAVCEGDMLEVMLLPGETL